jgi:3-methyladenine DNA glycosylase AlkD
MLDIICEAKTLFEQQRNDYQAKRMGAYMKNHFTFYGIASPQRKEITKVLKQKYILDKKDFLDFAKQCFECNEREMQYLFFDILEKYIKEFDEDTIKIAEYTITNKSWWDSVDATQGLLLRHTFIKHKSLLDAYTQKWMKDKNMWLNRVSITAQLGFKEQTNTDILTRNIEANMHQSAFFITKAIGWALREYAKTNPTWVWEFLNTHTLKPLSIREATKHLI